MITVIDFFSKWVVVFLAILAGVSPIHADKVVVNVKVFWNGVPPPPQSMLSGIDVDSNGAVASLKYDTQRGFYWAFSDSLLGKLGATDNIAVRIVPHINLQGVYLDLNDETPVLVRRESVDQRRVLSCFDKITYYGELVARATGSLNGIDAKAASERDKLFKAFFEYMRHARDVADKQDTQYCIKWTEGICRLIELSQVSEENKNYVSDWFDRACREASVKEGSINLARVISACARAKDKSWCDIGLYLLNLAQDNSLNPVYGVSDLWESLSQQKEYQKAYDLAVSQFDQISSEVNGRQIAWMRRALSSYNNIAASDSLRTSKWMAEGLKQRIELRKSVVGPLEFKSLQQMEMELSKYCI